MAAPAINSPAQSAVLAAAMVPAPPNIPSGASTNLTFIAAEDYCREVKKRRVGNVPTANHDDVCAAEVIFRLTVHA